MTTSYDTVEYSVTGRVAQILLNRPEALNAFNTALRDDLREALASAEKNDEVRVIVLGGKGRAFSAGADLSDGIGNNDTVEEAIMGEYWPLLQAIAESDKTVIAAVPGIMAGIGVAFAMTCDLVVMSDSGRLVSAFSNIALVPDGGCTWYLWQQLGYRRAYQLFAEGGELNARECLDYGVVNKLVPEGDVLSVAGQWAGELAERPPIALRETKKLLRNVGTLSFAEAVAREAAAQNTCFESGDAIEAAQAFLEKRKPTFRGR